MEKIALSFTLVWLRLGLLLAQPYAVDASLQLQAPMTPYLEDLTQTIPSPLQLNLILNDKDEQAYPVRLRFSISGQGISIRTRTDISPPPILLDYGILIQLTGAELIDYFLPEQLEFQGIDPMQFSQSGGRLPEGIYNICVEVLDYQRFQGAPISNQSCRVVEMAELLPPQILTPYGAIEATEAQNLLIQWVPQHIGNFPIQYTLSLWEMRPGLSLTQVRQQTLPIFEQVIGPSTTFLYGLDAPPLLPGANYLIQVQVEDLLEQHHFTNAGHSELVQFTYGATPSGNTANTPNDPCTLALEITKPQAPDFTTAWNSLPSAETYVLSVARDSQFQELLPGFEALPTVDTFYQLQGLPADGIVYLRVEALLSDCPPTTSQPVPFFLGKGCLPLPEEELAYACGTATDPSIPSQSHQLIQEIQIEDTIHAHDFQVIVQDIKGRGRFSGEGYVFVPYLQQARVNVEFSNIEVDEYCRLVSGKMEVTGAGLAIISEDLAATIDSILNALEILDAGLEEVESILEDAADFLGELEDIEDYLANGQNVLENLLHLEEHFPYLPPDAIKAIQEALDCLKAAQSATEFEDCKAQMLAAIDKLKEAMEALYDADYRVNFAALDKQQFGFDTIRHLAQADLYHKIPIAGTDYWVPWQSIPSQGTATVKAKAPSQNPFPEAIQFKNQLKQDISHTESPLPHSRHLHLNGSGHQQTERIYALQPYQDSLEQDLVHIAGQLSLISYDPIPLKVVLVPVNGTQYPHNIDTLSARLQSIFSQAVVNVELQIHPGLNISAFDNLLDSVPSGFLANYNIEMQLIRNRFQADNTIEEDTYYLFLVEDSEHPQKLGYMPQKKHFGFIYHDNQGSEQQYIKTIAHELAHGAYRLDHSFHDFPNLTPGETDNLMDYAMGIHLQKYQWDLIHNPAANWTLFDGDEEGESLIVNNISFFDSYRNSNGTLTFVSPSGRPITLPPEVDGVVFNTGDEINVGSDCYSRFEIYPFGSLRAFKIGNKFYKTSIVCNEQGGFAGYKDSNDLPYPDIYTKALSSSEKRAIVGVPCFESYSLKYKLSIVSFDKLEINENEINSEQYYAVGTRKTFDFLNIENLEIQGEIDGQSYPSYSPLSQLFLEKIYSATGCGNKSSLFAFVHAHQVTKYPELFQYCQDKLTDDVTAERLLQEMERVYRRLNLQTFEVESLHSQANDQITKAEIFSELEFNRWKDKDASIYKRYKDFINGNYSDAFFQSLTEDENGANTLLGYLENWQEDPCYFQYLSVENRIKALKVLQHSGLNGKFLFGLSGKEEENIFNYILSATPAKDYQKILALFAANKFELYYHIESKMRDSWRRQGNSPFGYEYFINTMAKMLLERSKEDPSHSVFCNTWVTGGHFCSVNGYSDNAHFIAKNPTLGTQHYYRRDFVDSQGQPKILLKSAHLDTPALAEPESHLTWINTRGTPFEYVGLYFSYDATFDMPGGSSITVPEQSYLVVPFCWAEWYFRKMNSALFNHRFRVIADIVALAAAPVTLGSSTVSIGWKVLSVVDGVYGAVDMFVFAPSSYNIDLSGHPLISQDLQRIWDELGLALAAASISGLISTSASGIKAFSPQKIKQTWKYIVDNTPNPDTRAQTLEQLKSALTKTTERLAQATQAVNAANLNKLLVHLRAEIASLDITTKLRNFRSDFTFHVKQSFWAILMRANIEYSIARGVFIDEVYHLQPNRWIHTPTEELIHIGDLDKVRYITELGIPKEGNLSLYRDPVTNTILVLDRAFTSLADRLTVAGANPALILDVLSLGLPKATALTDDLVEIGGDYLKAFNESALGDGGIVQTWQRISIDESPGSDLLRKNVTTLIEIDKLLSATTIGETDLEFFIAALNELKLRGISDEDLIEIGEYTIKAQVYTFQWNIYNVETDLLGQIYKLAASPNYKNPEALVPFIKNPGLAATVRDNPGTLEQLNEAVRLIGEGKMVKLEDIAKDGDIVNLTDGISFQYKAYTGASNSAFNDNLKKAAKQFNSEPTNLDKIVKIKILNTNSLMYNSSAQALRNQIQTIFNSNSDVASNLNELKEIHIENASGLLRFEIVNDIVFIL